MGSRETSFLSWLGTIWQLLTAPAPVPPYDDDWKKIERWCKEEFEPLEGVDYREMLSDAERRYEQLMDSNAKVEQRAEWLFGIALAVSAGVISQVVGSPVGFRWATIPVALMSMSMFFAMRIRGRAKSPVPINGWHLHNIQLKGFKATPYLFASTVAASEGLLRVNRWKGGLIGESIRFLLFGAVTSILPIAVLTFSEQPEPTTVPVQILSTGMHLEPELAPVRAADLAPDEVSPREKEPTDPDGPQELEVIPLLEPLGDRDAAAR